MPIRPIKSAPIAGEPVHEAAPTQSLPSAPPPAFDYEVGYGKPPRQTQFRPGQSGNLKGRPKGAKGINVIVRGLLTQKVTVRTAGGPQRLSKMEAALHKLVEKAFGGDTRAVGSLIDLYRASVPDEPAEGTGGGSGDAQGAVRSEQDAAAYEALCDLIRDGMQQSPDQEVE